MQFCWMNLKWENKAGIQIVGLYWRLLGDLSMTTDEESKTTAIAIKIQPYLNDVRFLFKTISKRHPEKKWVEYALNTIQQLEEYLEWY